MVIQRIIQRHFCKTFSNGKKSLANGAIKGLFLKKTKNYVSVINARLYSAYEGDGKTIAGVINKKGANTLYIEKLMTDGFIMPSGAHILGSLMIFPHTVMSWHVSEADQVTEESLVLFKLLEPKIDILVFGYGNRKDYTPEVREKFTKICKKLGLRFEALPTEQAVGTYNFLAEERRLVAGALIPPRFIDVLKLDRKKDFFLEGGEEEEEEELKTISEDFSQKKFIK